MNTLTILQQLAVAPALGGSLIQLIIAGIVFAIVFVIINAIPMVEWLKKILILILSGVTAIWAIKLLLSFL